MRELRPTSAKKSDFVFQCRRIATYAYATTARRRRQKFRFYFSARSNCAGRHVIQSESCAPRGPIFSILFLASTDFQRRTLLLAQNPGSPAGWPAFRFGAAVSVIAAPLFWVELLPWSRRSQRIGPCAASGGRNSRCQPRPSGGSGDPSRAIWPLPRASPACSVVG